MRGGVGAFSGLLVFSEGRNAGAEGGFPNVRVFGTSVLTSKRGNRCGTGTAAQRIH